MALLFIDGFENYGTTTGSAPSPAGVVACKYPGTFNEYLSKIRAGRYGGYALDLNGTPDWIGVVGLTTNDTVTIGVAFKCASVSSSAYFLALFDGATLGVNVRFAGGGELSVYRGDNLLKTSTGAGLTVDNWFYLELKVKCHSSTGTYELRIGGENVCSGTGANTQAGANAYHTGFYLLGLNQAVNGPAFDDLYFLDASGSVNTTFLGNVRVVTIRPDEATADADFTPDTGDNYARVNEAVRGDDSDYVESATSTDKDLYGYAALPTLNQIAGIVICTDCRETDASSFSIKTVCKSGATESADAGQAVGSANYVTRSRIIEIDPNTVSDAWTKTTLDAATIGFEVA